MAWQHVLVIVLCHFPSHAHASHVCCNRGHVESWRGFVTGARRRACDVLLSRYLYIWSAVWLRSWWLGRCRSAPGSRSYFALVTTALVTGARRQQANIHYSPVSLSFTRLHYPYLTHQQFCSGGSVGKVAVDKLANRLLFSRDIVAKNSSYAILSITISNQGLGRMLSSLTKEA